jgi:hypothetical protein
MVKQLKERREHIELPRTGVGVNIASVTQCKETRPFIVKAPRKTK